jgi:L-malate glycosyltransferase
VKIGIYNEPGGTGIGGAENVVAVIANVLTNEHEVEVVHHINGLRLETLVQSSGLDLKGVRLRYVERDRDTNPYHRNPLLRYRAARAWHATLSQPYDLFIATLHDIPPFCHARDGALIILFPGRSSPHVEVPAEVLRQSRLRQNIERAYQRYEWKKRMGGYRVVTSISEFTRLWTRRRWGIESEVVYPPVNTDFERVEKERLILSVGRFALEGEGHTKQQGKLLAVFSQMERQDLLDWKYVSVGGLSDSPKHDAFFRSLSERAADCHGARVAANIARNELELLYQRASIFWHAAGYGANEESDPVLMEHFGISTVEAMAAGCVPVVINRGGQREIVEQGVSGFRWETIEELKDYTARLARDHYLRKQMSEAARERARFFDRKEFIRRFVSSLRLSVPPT